MKDQLQEKMQSIDRMSEDELKSMSLYEFDEFAVGVTHTEARLLLRHAYNRLGQITKKLPAVDFGYGEIEEIRSDYKVVEFAVNHLFDELIPAIRNRATIPDIIESEIAVINNVYFTFSEKVNEEFDTFLNID